MESTYLVPHRLYSGNTTILLPASLDKDTMWAIMFAFVSAVTSMLLSDVALSGENSTTVALNPSLAQAVTTKAAMPASTTATRGDEMAITNYGNGGVLLNREKSGLNLGFTAPRFGRSGITIHSRQAPPTQTKRSAQEVWFPDGPPM